MSTEARVCLVTCLFRKSSSYAFGHLGSMSPDRAQDSLLGIHSSRNTASRVQGDRFGASEKKHLL